MTYKRIQAKSGKKPEADLTFDIFVFVIDLFLFTAVSIEKKINIALNETLWHRYYYDFAM